MVVVVRAADIGPLAKIPLVIWLLAVIKITLLLAYHPIPSPDTAGYVQIADQILSGWAWIHTVNFADGASIQTAYRMIGYPLAIAASKLLFGTYWQLAVAVAQITLSLVASWSFFRLCLLLSRSMVVVQLAVFASATGLGLVVDQSLLSDSFFGSIMILVVCRLSRDILENRPASARVAAISGAGLAAMFLLRDSALYLIVFFIPLAFFWLRRLDCRVAVLRGLILFAPFALVVVSYPLWNAYRSGYLFITTCGHTAFPLALAEIAKEGVPVFEGDTPFERVARQEFHDYSFGEVLILNKVLLTSFGLNPVEISRAASRLYTNVWLKHPLGTALALGKLIKEDHHIFIAFRPDEGLAVVPFWAGAERFWPKSIAVWQAYKLDHDVSWLPLLALQAMIRVISTLVFILFLAAPVVVMLGPRRQEYLVLLPWWILYFGFLGTYTLIHGDLRYFIPVVPFVISSSILVATHRLPSIWHRRS